MVKKVQARMSTEVALDVLKASESLSSLKQVVNSTTKAWQAQSKQMASAGDYINAAQRKYEGLGKSIKAQETYIESLKSKQSELSGNTEKTAKEYLKFQKNIDSATTRLKSMEAQQGRAKSAMEAQQSGLAKLQSDYKTLTKASSAYANRLSAEGNKASATVAKYNGLKKSLGNLKDQYKAQTAKLERVARESGKASSAYQRQKTKLDETGRSVAEIRSKMKSMNSAMSKLQPTGINKIDRAVVKVKDNTGKMATSAKAGFAKFKSAAMAASVGVAALGTSLLSGAKQASSLQNAYVTNANLMSTAGEKQADVQKAVNNMQKDGKKYSIEYGESQKTIADGYQELIKRGYTSNQALGSMKSILQASKASGDSFNDTMTVTTSTMEAFGMKSNDTATQMKNTSKVANTLAMAADATSTNFSDLGVGMSYVGTSAKQAGLTLKDTASAMGVLSNSGIEADKAGTGLRKAINSLISPTATGTDALKKYGMSVDDFKDKSGKLKPVGTIFKEIGDKVPKGDQANFFHNVFGTTGQNAAAVLAQNVDQLDKVNKQVGGAYKNDYVGKLANKNMKSTQNSTKQFKEAFKAIQIELGTALMPALSKAAKGMAKAFETKSFQKGLKTFAKGIGDTANVLVSFVEFVGKHGKTIKTFGEILLGTFVSTKLIAGIVNIKNAIGAIKVAKTVADIKDLKDVAKGLGGLKIGAKWTGGKAVNASKTAIKGVGKAASAIKRITISIVTKAAELALLGFRKAITLTTKGFKLLKLAMVANPFGAIVLAVTAIGTALTVLYKHNSKFRKFVNGLGKDAKGALKDTGKWFVGIGKGIESAWKSGKKNFDKGVKSLDSSWKALKKNTSKGMSSAWSDTKKTVLNGWNTYNKYMSAGSKTAGKIWDSLKKTTSKSISSMFSSSKKTVQNGWKNIQSWTKSGANNVAKSYNDMKAATGKVVSQMMKDHPKTFKNGYNVIQNYTKAWADVVNGRWSDLGGDLKNTANSINKFERGLFSGMYNYLNKLTGGRLGDMVKLVQDAGSKVSNAWKNTWNGIKSFFSGIWSSIKNLAKDGMQGVVSFINSGIGGIDTVIKFFGGKASAVPKIKLAAGTQNGRLTHNTLAVLNDGNDSPETGNREMVQKKNGSSYLVKGRNTVALLEAGDAVFNAKQTKQIMMSMLPHFANGSIIGKATDWIADKVGDVGSWLGDQMTAIEKFMKNPVSEMTKVFDKYTKGNLNSTFAKDFAKPGGHYIVKEGKDWFSKLLKSLEGSMDNPGGAGTARWKPVIQAVAERMHVDLTGAGMNAVLHRITQESNGSATVTNNWDSNAKAGHPSTGLLQYIQPTFDHWLPKGFKNDIHNGSSQIAAMFNDTNWLRDISVKGGWGPTGHKRMANGGLVSTHQMVEMAEGNKPEMVVPLDAMKGSRAWQLLAKVANTFAGGTASQNVSSGNVKGSEDYKQLNDKFDQLLNRFDELLTMTSSQTQTIRETAFDKKQLYKREAKDLTTQTWTSMA